MQGDSRDQATIEQALTAYNCSPVIHFAGLNLGTGIGYSVLDVVRAFEAASGQAIPYQLCSRRPGDVASCYADPRLAK